MDYGIIGATYTPTMRVASVVPPAVEPVALAEAKAWARVEFPDGDPTFLDLIVGIREVMEAECRLSFISQTRCLFLGGFPSMWGQVLLPYPPLQAILAVNYLDTTGVLRTVDPASYVYSPGSIPGRVWLPYGSAWPVTGPYPDAVQVTYTCGYGDAAADVPMAARLAMRSLIAANYNNADGVQFLQGGTMQTTPLFDGFVRSLSFGFYG